MPFIIVHDRFLLTQSTSVARDWIVLMWIETELYFSSSSESDECLSLPVMRNYLSWRLHIFLLFVRLRHIQIRGQKLNWELKRVFTSINLLDNPIEGKILTKSFSILLAFLHISEMSPAKFIFQSNLILSNFSHLLFLISYSLTLTATFYSVPISKWHLPGLLFKRLLSKSEKQKNFSNRIICPIIY